MKKTTTKKTPDQEEDKKPPLTFTDAETKQFADFINFVYQHTQFKDMDWGTATKAQTMLGHMRLLLRKMEAYVMEPPRMIPTKGK